MGIMGTPGAAYDASPDETRRQRAVESLGLGEGGGDPRLDRIARLAGRVLEMPIASVTVLDGDRARFPGLHGLDDVTEMARHDTFCDRTQQGGDLLVVEDATTDDRFAHLPVVVEHGVRFYAGQPLRDHLGNIVGSFCVYDRRARTLDGDERETLLDLAAWAQHELVSSTEMSQAGQVQASLLPARPLRVPGWTVDGLCLPALAVGGDFYDFGCTQGVIHVGLGDVMGKGTAAALLGAGVRAAVRGTHEAVVAGVDLGITSTQVARGLLSDLERAESFVTLLEVAVDLDDGFSRYVDAGSGLALLVRAGGEPERLRSEDRPFGVLPEDHWTEHQVKLEPGDRLLLFSDGLLDLLDDPVDWVPEVTALVTVAPDGPGVLAAVLALGHARTPLDDVTAVVVARELAT